MIVVGLVWIVLPAATYLVWGRTVLEKLATHMVLPLGLLFQLLVVITLYQFVRRSRWWWGALLLLCGYAVVTCPLLANLAMLSLERHYPPYDATADPEGLDAVIVLGGGLRVNRFLEVESTDDGHRALQAAQLYHAGEVPQIIVTGSQIAATRRHDISPAVAAERLLVSLGVPRERIVKVPGINTSAEMQSLRSHFADSGQPEHYGLITSAFHMPRAMRLASAAELDPIPMPCCFRGDPQLLTILDLAPSAGAVETFSVVMKEYLAKLVGR